MHVPELAKIGKIFMQARGVGEMGESIVPADFALGNLPKGKGSGGGAADIALLFCTYGLERLPRGVEIAGVKGRAGGIGGGAAVIAKLPPQRCDLCLQRSDRAFRVCTFGPHRIQFFQDHRLFRRMGALQIRAQRCFAGFERGEVFFIGHALVERAAGHLPDGRAAAGLGHARMRSVADDEFGLCRIRLAPEQDPPQAAKRREDFLDYRNTGSKGGQERLISRLIQPL